MDYLKNEFIFKRIHKQKRNGNFHLLNPQYVPVYCVGQTHEPFTHGLLE